MRRLTDRLQGLFDSQNWIEEGDGLFVSARIIRAEWILYRRNLKRHKDAGPFRKEIVWSKLIGMPRSSMLLLSYSTEMYLKAGLIKACKGCSEEFFRHLSQRKYGHRLHALAREIEFPLADSHGADFSTLSEMITKTARYPLDPEKGINYNDLINRRTQSTWDALSFRRYSNLAKDVRKFTSSLDCDSSNPVFYAGNTIDQTGYFASRIGGGLRSRLTFRYSSEMQQSGKANLEDLRALLDANDMRKVTMFWSEYKFIEDRGPPYK